MNEWLKDGSLFYREERTIMWEKGTDTIFVNGHFTREEHNQINRIINEEDDMSEFKQYRRKGLSEMRPYVLGEDLQKISVSDTDNPPEDMGMIARNPKNHADQWYVARKYFEDNLEPV